MVNIHVTCVIGEHQKRKNKMFDISIDWEVIKGTFTAIIEGNATLDIPYVLEQLYFFGLLLIGIALWTLIYFIFAIPTLFMISMGIITLILSFKLFFWITYLR